MMALTTMWRLASAMSLLLWSQDAKAEEQASTEPAAMPAFQEAFGRIARNEGDALNEYQALRSHYARMGERERSQIAQQLSMADAMFGRYQDAEEDYYVAFPAGRKPIKCPSIAVTPEPALEAIRRLAENARVVMVNESHSLATTRAFLYDVIPVLRALGFNYLALEALAPASDELPYDRPLKALQDGGLVSRGYPLDRSSPGFYLREPIYAELVREAIAQGFALVAYEALAARSRDEREAGQADALARLVASDPNARIAVLAGYSHIWKADGWMAERLQKAIGGRVVSIDQTSGVFGCEMAPSTGSLGPYILVDEDGAEWSFMPDRVDVTVLHRARKDGRTAPSGWLTLGGRRKAVEPDFLACGDAWPCLISAGYVDEAENSVPADRVLLKGADDRSLIFLKPGTYRYEIKPHGHPKIVRELKIL